MRPHCSLQLLHVSQIHVYSLSGLFTPKRAIEAIKLIEKDSLLQFGQRTQGRLLKAFICDTQYILRFLRVEDEQDLSV